MSPHRLRRAGSHPTARRAQRCYQFHCYSPLVFEKILRELLAATPGAIGAIVLDREGESVQFWAERVFDIGPDGLRAIGAYQGIYLAELRRICDRVDLGPAHRFATEFSHT